MKLPMPDEAKEAICKAQEQLQQIIGLLESILEELQTQRRTDE